MKKIWYLVFSIVLCVALAACSNQIGKGEEKDSNTPPSATPTVTDTPKEPDELVDNPSEMYQAYFTALENLIQNHVLPDGTDVGEPFGDVSENKFAVYDIDNDGKEELIILYSTTATVGMAGCVYGYNSKTGTLQAELQEFPLLTFYDNGIVKALWSHNQGLAGDFWPYNLYQYNTDSDSYTLVGMVDAWDKKYVETDYEGNSFPSDIDKSGTGIVYYIMEDGEYDNTHPVDAVEYEKWTDSHIGKALEIQIPYKDLTEENIAQIKDGL